MRHPWVALTLLFIGGNVLSSINASAGRVEGQLVLGTTREFDSANLASVPVTLLTFEMGSGESQELKTETDEEGRFAFDDLKTGPDVGYKAWATYRGARYEGEPFRILQEDEGSKQVAITVYDVTHDSQAIDVLRHHFMMRQEENSLAVTEYLVIHNGGEKTYFGRGTPQSPDPQTMQHSLPVGAVDIELGESFDQASTHLATFGFYDSQPVPPGIREVSFSYRMPVVSRFEKTIYYRTHTFDLFFSNPDARISSPQLGPAEMETLENRQFLYLKGADVAPATQIAVHMDGIVPFNYRKFFKALTLLLSAGVLAAGIGIALYRRRSSSGAEASNSPAASTENAAANPTQDQIERP